MTAGRGAGGWRFWLLALLWLPAGLVLQALLRFPPEAASAGGPGLWQAMPPLALVSLALAAPCGLPLALACRRLWRLGHRRAAWATGIGLAAPAVAAAVLAGLLGPVAIAAAAILFSLPAWIAALWLGRRR